MNREQMVYKKTKEEREILYCVNRMTEIKKKILVDIRTISKTDKREKVRRKLEES